MKKVSFYAILAAAFMTAGLCSCKKDSPIDNFDHLEISYTFETNDQSKQCFDTKLEFLCDGTIVDSDYFNVVKMTGELEDERLVPNSTITVRTVPELVKDLPATLEPELDYEIIVSAISKSGEVLDSYSVKERRSLTQPVDLSTEEGKKSALALFTIEFKVKVKKIDGTISIESAE